MKKILGSFILLTQLLFASISINLNKSEIEAGDSVIFTISYSGSENIEFPIIDNIEGFRVQSGAKSERMQVINGQVSRAVSQSYIFSPSRSLKIPKFKIIVNGVTYETEELDLIVKKVANSEFEYTITSSKSSGYIGEPIEISLELKRKKGIDISDYRFSNFDFRDFYFREIEQDVSYESGDYIVLKKRLLLFPKRAGELKIEPLSANLAVIRESVDYFGFRIRQPQWKSIYSNELTFTISEAPTKLVGKFKIEAKVDKDKIYSNEPVNLEVIISGAGNLDDIPEINLNIGGLNIYGDKAVKDYKFLNGEYVGKYSKKFAIISNGDSFTIPKIKLEYFDIIEKKSKSIITDEIFIEVVKKVDKKELVVVEGEEKSSNLINNQILILLFLAGFIVGFLIATLIFKVKFKRKKEKPQNEKELLFELLKYSKDDRAFEYIKELENSIYRNGASKYSLKDIKKFIKELEHEKNSNNSNI